MLNPEGGMRLAEAPAINQDILAFPPEYLIIQ